MRFKPDGPLEVTIHHDHDFHKDDVEDVIDKITESVVTIIVVASAAHILRKWVT
jgi:hypothetical protein